MVTFEELEQVKKKYMAENPGKSFPDDYVKDYAERIEKEFIHPFVMNNMQQGKSPAYIYDSLVMLGAKVINDFMDKADGLWWREPTFSIGEQIKLFENQTSEEVDWIGRSIGISPLLWLSTYFREDSEIRRNVDTMVKRIMQSAISTLDVLAGNSRLYFTALTSFPNWLIRCICQKSIEPYAELMGYSYSYFNECFLFLKEIRSYYSAFGQLV